MLYLTSFGHFSPHTATMRSFFAQKDRIGVFKFILDCLDHFDIGIKCTT